MVNALSQLTIDITPVSENAIIITWPEIIDELQHQQIINYQQVLTNALSPVIIETVLSYNALMVYYHFEKISLDSLISRLKQLLEKSLLNKSSTIRDSAKSLPPIEIPVYYGEESGWDLIHVANRLSLSVEQVIALHSSRTYRAYAQGFTPGFCYLGRLTKQLKLPRKKTPRIKIPKGAIAIAERQTAVYPNNSPGGWHILGQTPIDMYEVLTQSGIAQPGTSKQSNLHYSATINVGQLVTFTAINYETFCQLGGILEVEPNEP